MPRPACAAGAAADDGITSILTLPTTEVWKLTEMRGAVAPAVVVVVVVVTEAPAAADAAAAAATLPLLHCGTSRG